MAVQIIVPDGSGGSSGGSVGITYITSGASFTGTYELTYFNMNQADVEFINIVLLNCWVKNIGGTVTYTGTAKGGYTISDHDIPSTMSGEVQDATNF